MKKYIYTLVFGLIFCVTATGQDEITPTPYLQKNQFSITWDIAFPTSDYVGETTTSSIKVKEDRVKGRVIGKEGRNIRAFEKITGVEVIVDESPDSIILSSFDPLRREVARVAMSRLIKDGRIHPGSIEEAVKKEKNDISKEIRKNGQVLAEEAGWPGIDINLLKLVGKMKYRTSYGQSLMSAVQ